jgi:hypothetical protein
MSMRRSSAGLLIACLLAALWSWWAWKAGAYFGVVFYPGAIALLCLAALLLLRAPLEARLSGIPDLAFGALLLIGALSMFSVLWTPAREVAFEDAQHAVLYAAAFLVGLWAAHLLGRRMLLSLLPLATACGVAGLVALVTIWTGDDVARYLEGDGTLRFPIGYRNANAAFFAIGFWPALTLASRSETAWWLRAAMLGVATLAIEMVILSQSRGSVFAAALALVVYLALVPGRVRTLAYIGLAALPAALALPWLLDVFQAGGGAASLEALRPAARAAALGAGAAVLLGALAATVSERFDGEPAPGREPARPLAIGAALILAISAATLAVTSTDPVDWLNQRAREFRQGGTPDLSAQGSRFGTNLSSDRTDLWRVAWEDAKQRPLLGEGAGGFQYSYLRDRETEQTPNDPHSVELLMLSELGMGGLLLLVCFLAAAAIGVLRSAALGPSSAALSAAALAAGTYWLAHASIEWFWSYPGLTAPTIALLGAACAPARLEPGAGPRRPARAALATVAIAVAIAAVPAFLSDRYTDAAYREAGSDIDGAYADLGRAEDLNPLSDKPALAEGALAKAAGDPDRALAALRRAEARKPDEWATHFLLGQLLAESDPGAARRELERARELNPGDARIRTLLSNLR